MLRLTSTTSRPARRGFTLAEVLGVVVILGAISATIIPQISNRNDQRTASASRVVMSDLLYVQNRAVSQQKMHYVKFDLAGQTYKVLDRLSPESVIKHPVDGSTFVVQFGSAAKGELKNMTLKSVTFDEQKILAFDVMGIPYSVNASTGVKTPLTTGRIVVGSGTYQLTITVSPYSGELLVQ